MSDELLKGGGIGAGAAGILGILWAAFIRRGEKAEDKVDADRDARVLHLEKRLDGVSTNHGERIRELELLCARLDQRLLAREGLQGLQHTGVTVLTPEQQAILAKIEEVSK